MKMIAEGLLKDRFTESRERLETALEVYGPWQALHPRMNPHLPKFASGRKHRESTRYQATEEKRVGLYKDVVSLIYKQLANEIHRIDL
jgi:type I restriction enzyme R subunit